MSVIKSGYSVFKSFEVEDVVAEVLHSSKSGCCEFSPRVSKDLDSEVNAVTGALYVSKGMACRKAVYSVRATLA